MSTPKLREVWLEEDLVEHLLRSANQDGTTVSQYLRPRLGLPEPRDMAVAGSRNGDGGTRGVPSALAECWTDPEFRAARNVADRYRAILAHLYRRDPLAFERVITIQGDKRVYFARGEQDFLATNRSPNPKPIPGTPYWAETRMQTRFKADVLDRVLEMLGYDARSRKEARDALERE
jgi:negative modulator of initiation of replication